VISYCECFFTKQISNSVWYYVNYCNNIRVKKTFTLIIDLLLIEKEQNAPLYGKGLYALGGLNK